MKTMGHACIGEGFPWGGGEFGEEEKRGLKITFGTLWFLNY